MKWNLKSKGLDCLACTDCLTLSPLPFKHAVPQCLDLGLYLPNFERNKRIINKLDNINLLIGANIPLFIDSVIFPLKNPTYFGMQDCSVGIIL